MSSSPPLLFDLLCLEQLCPSFGQETIPYLVI